MNDLSDVFFQECDDLLEGLTEGLDSLDNHTGDDETVNGMFRAVHSIKGGAGAFGLDQLVSFAHAYENVLDDMRSSKLEADQNVISLLITAADHLYDLVEAARNGETLGAEIGASTLRDLQLLSSASDPESSGEPTEDPPDFQPLMLSFEGELPPLETLVTPVSLTWAINFKASAQLYQNGHDTALLFRALSSLGEITVKALQEGVVELEAFEPTSPKLSWHVRLCCESDIAEQDIRDVFEFVEGLCDLIIEPIQADANEPDAPEQTALPPLVASGASCSEIDEGLSEESSAQKPRTQRNNTIRVDLERVDRLINLVGEMVIAEAMLRQSMDGQFHSDGGRIEDAMGQLKQLSGAIQESVMAIRAQPVRGLFQRMSRIVRESSREAGKQARLVTIGDATEVDKTVTERLVEPLTHMIRNAVDHGLETPEQRKAAGKEERGTVTLEAAHRSGRVIIVLSDDGAGINRAKVRKVAVEKGLIRADEDLNDSDIDNLLFRPGFSTADEVSNLSGRGVGMDVVRNEILSLGGRVTISSEPGRGTQVRISLPLTLAVLEGMVIKVASETLVVPTLPLREMLRPGQAVIHTLCDGDNVLALQDGVIPISDLGTALGYRSAPPDVETQSLLLIEGDSGRRFALAVDTIAEQREVVIKGLEQNYTSIPGIAAATILGDGHIALIVDTDQLSSLPHANSPLDFTASAPRGDTLHA